MAKTLDYKALSALRKSLIADFDGDDLRTLCASVGADYDDVAGKDKSGKTRELVAWLNRRGRIDELVQAADQLRSTAAQRKATPSISQGRLRLPARCPYCGAPVSPNEVKWLNDVTATCAYCQSTLEARSAQAP